MVTKELLKQKYNISEALIQNAEISWDDFCEIWEDFSKNKYDKYKAIMEEFIDTYLKDINDKVKFERGKEVNIHSVCSRVKDAEHLIVKIIRKKQENQKEYRNLDWNDSKGIAEC